MKNKNFNGVNRIDRLMQRQYLGEKWDTMDEDVKKKHLVSSAHKFKVFLGGNGYCFVAVKENRFVCDVSKHEYLII